jgi:hypothetical protein
MADLADFAWGICPYNANLAGTVTYDATWVYVTGTLTIDDGYAYGRIDTSGNIIGTGNEIGGIGIPYDSPYWFCRLPNPPYGAKIIYADDFSTTTPNAMTDLDPSYYGVNRNPDYLPYGGKFLNDQVRSLYVSGSYELAPNGIFRDYHYVSVQHIVLDQTDPAHPFWKFEAGTPLVDLSNDYEMRVLSRGIYTYIGLGGAFPPPPNMIIDFTMQWWNGPGFRCGDTSLVQVD